MGWPAASPTSRTCTSRPHGGRVVTPPYPEGTLRVALFADPAGTVLGVWQETSGDTGPR